MHDQIVYTRINVYQKCNRMGPYYISIIQKGGPIEWDLTTYLSSKRVDPNLSKIYAIYIRRTTFPSPDPPFFPRMSSCKAKLSFAQICVAFGLRMLITSW